MLGLYMGLWEGSSTRYLRALNNFSIMEVLGKIEEIS
jgi:hypothetical protein